MLFGSVPRIELAIRQLLGARKHSASYRIVSPERRDKTSVSQFNADIPESQIPLC